MANVRADHQFGDGYKSQHGTDARAAFTVAAETRNREPTSVLLSWGAMILLIWLAVIGAALAVAAALVAVAWRSRLFLMPGVVAALGPWALIAAESGSKHLKADLLSLTQGSFGIASGVPLLWLTPVSLLMLGYAAVRLTLRRP